MSSNTFELSQEVLTGPVIVTWELYAGESTFSGAATYGGVRLTVLTDGWTANVTLSGPATKWFAVGLDATMHTTAGRRPYTIAVDGAGTVTEWLLGYDTMGERLPPVGAGSSLKVLSSTVVNGVRTVTISLPASSASYTFPKAAGLLNVISAVGLTSALSAHGTNFQAGTITLAKINTIPPANRVVYTDVRVGQADVGPSTVYVSLVDMSTPCDTRPKGRGTFAITMESLTPTVRGFAIDENYFSRQKLVWYWPEDPLPKENPDMQTVMGAQKIPPYEVFMPLRYTPEG